MKCQDSFGHFFDTSTPLKDITNVPITEVCLNIYFQFHFIN